MEPTHAQAYWRTNKRLIVILLAIWGLVSLGAGIVFVRPLNTVALGQVPLGFWMAQQGSIFVFVLIIFFYAWRLDVLDRKFHVDSDHEAPPPIQH